MRISTCPRLPDGDCVFISDERIITGANSSSTRLFFKRVMHEVSQGEGSLRLTQPEVERVVRQLHHKDLRRGPAYTAPSSFRSAGGRGAIR